MYNFFVEDNQVIEDNIKIIGEDYKHISKVLRMSVGEKISICIKQTEERFLVEIIEND